MTKKTEVAEPANYIAVFQKTSFRRVWRNEEWWFSVGDVCAILTESLDAGACWRKLKQRLNAEGGQSVPVCHGLKLRAPDGKMRETNCANTEGLYHSIQSIPSRKADPFKRWLAHVGYERVKEIENPEMASARATFGVTPGEHSQLKSLHAVKTGNHLRDHMTDQELIFSMLGEASTARAKPAKGGSARHQTMHS